MIITNGQILLMIIMGIVYAISKFTRKRNTYSKQQLQEISWKANENRHKAGQISDGFYYAMEYYQNLSFQQWEKEDMEFLQALIKHCEIKLCEANEIECEWKFLGDYIDYGVMHMGRSDYAEPSINIRKQFNKNYRKSMEIGRNLKTVQKAAKVLRNRYGFLYQLPDHANHSEGDLLW